MATYHPSREEFLRRAKMGNMTPVYREVLADLETPVSAFRKITGGEFSFLLESVEGGERIGRFSFLGSGAQTVVSSKGRTVSIKTPEQTREITLEDGKDVLGVVKQQIEQVKYVPDPELPRFCGGAVGYISYDAVRFFEELPEATTDDLNVPDCCLVFTDTLLVFDQVKHRIRAVCNARVDGDPDTAYDEAITKIEELLDRLRKPMSGNGHKTSTPNEIESNFSKAEFETAVESAKEYIRAGDVIQVVLSQRFKTTVAAEPFDIYRALRSLNPSPYMYYLSYGDTKLIGSSPEILVTCEQGKVTNRPIAGTRPRGATEEEDQRLEAELLADEKERCEHIMLVDLGRNDVGRVCEYGSVHVDELMTIERYSHVMHIVSNVTGKLREDHDQFDVLRACFPAGTVSGAPKVRAMEIIEELEPTRRGTYAGAIGYFSYSGDMDTCITIRTILLQGSTAYIQAGAGIVADSDPATEYLETQNKARALVGAIRMAENGLEVQ